MRTVLIASLRTQTRRYVAAAVAVVMAVAFIVIVNALASATKNGLSAGVDQAYTGTQLVIGDRSGLDDKDLTRVDDLAQRHGDQLAVVASTWTDVSSDGRSLGSEVPVGTVADDPDLRRQKILSGRAPRAPDEALVDRSAARSNDVRIGDELTVGAGTSAVRVRVVGTAAAASYLSADVYLPWSAMQQLPSTWVDTVGYASSSGAVDVRATELRDAVSVPVRSTDDFVSARIQEINQGIDVISYLLLLFAGIAGFVAALVIANTFTILFAQRTRDLALLRCVGATKRQVMRSVRLEAAVLALAASAIGLGIGAALGYGAAAVIRALAGPTTLGSVSLSPAWLAAAFVGGVAMTVGAAWWPTRRVVRVSPLAALRPIETPSVKTTAGRVRTLFGLVVLVGSAVVLGLAAAAHALPLLIVGGMASFVGVLLLGPVIVPAMMRGLGRVGGRFGPSVRIAAANAVRNPHRSAATTASLLVGVTLASAVLTGMASARSAINHELDGDHPIDVALTATSRLDHAAVERAQAAPDVERAAPVDGVRAAASGIGSVTVLAPGSAARAVSHDGSLVRARPGTVLVPDSLAGEVGKTLRLRTDTGTASLTVAVVGGGWGDALVVAPSTLSQLDRTPTTHAIWVRAESGADADALGRSLSSIGRSADASLVNGLKERSWVDVQLDIVIWSVLGLLGVGIAIALVGIANTVGLSVLERGREHALLRALGLTTRQLRRVLTAEGLLLAFVAAGLGTALGVLYGWLGVLTIVRTAVPDAPLVTPWASLAAVVVAAAISGPLACALPARRASRVAPAQGLTLD